jgi:hypothetical protein
LSGATLKKIKTLWSSIKRIKSKKKLNTKFYSQLYTTLHRCVSNLIWTSTCGEEWGPSLFLSNGLGQTCTKKGCGLAYNQAFQEYHNFQRASHTKGCAQVSQ